ncbi:MFS transporter [Arthrobacter sp. PAMC25564]|uniref:MFS transporter n=1 Tax=Arthrobacter sp. PAMC25564 TaxID=2565366 RepID=UPI0010A23053|nr:MFS transporter [Arthrobacter sp. PAMC25564]QCB97480.1 MFS transporter [Arthrobacter sp. PAMC25564]
MTGRTGKTSANRLGPMGFVLAFGVVSMLADVVYEGARSITGPFLATLGASAVMVGFITGFGEAVALVLRLGTGPLADRTRKYWPLTIAGYALTVIAVPLLALASSLWQASALVVMERFGKAVRTPARDTMLSHAGAEMGRGKAFAIHEALDQSGALLGPLLMGLMIAVSGYQLGFGVLAIPGALALVAVLLLRRAVPVPERFDAQAVTDHAVERGSRAARVPLPARFWWYSAFTAVSMFGFSTFGVISYHLEVQKVLPSALIPVTYAVSMGAAALAALASGALYDRIGLRGLLIALPLTAAVPFLSFTTAPALVWAGAVVWGAALGIHESTLRAAVADLVPAVRRGTGYGIFTAGYGMAWLAGSTIIGALYTASYAGLVIFTVGTQLVALIVFIPLLRASAPDARRV